MKKKLKKSNIKNVEDLIDNLNQPINYLSNKYYVDGFGKNDLKQELYLKIIIDYDKFGKKSRGWWFKRLQWYIYNMIKKSELKPLSSAIRLDKYYGK